MMPAPKFPQYKTLIFETWPIERCIGYARNPRKNDHAVDRVASAIREFWVSRADRRQVRRHGGGRSSEAKGRHAHGAVIVLCHALVSSLSVSVVRES